MVQHRRKTEKKEKRVRSKPDRDLETNTDNEEVPEKYVYTREQRNTKRKAVYPLVLFPTWIPWILTLFTIVTRIYYVLKRKNWWILHPDEVFQGVEVSHSLVYGYGFRMYEYLPPIVINRTTAAEDQELSLGIYSTRSFLYPYIFTPFLYAIKYSGVNINSFMVCKLVHASVSSLLPWATYRFTSVMFKKSDIGVMASAFVTFSLHLNIFATHCLVNSFVSPIFFFCISEILFFGEDELFQSSHNQGQVTPTDTFIKKCMKLISYVLNGFQNSSYIEPDVDMRHQFSIPRLLISSFILGLVIYIKIDLLLPLIVLFVMEIVRYPKYISDYKIYWNRYKFCRVGITLAILIGGYVDFVTYGVWFLSPIQCIKLSFIRDMSSKYVDKCLPLEYLDILNENRTCSWLNVCAAIVIFMTLKKSNYRWSTASIIVTSACILVVFSMQWNKEPRLIFNVYVLICILWAVSIQTIFDALNLRKQKWLAITFMSSILAAYASDSFMDFPTSRNPSSTKWSHNDMADSAAINECIARMGQVSDVTGVFIDYTLYATGGFSLLNKDVPLITKIQHEYYEYDLSDRPQYRSGLEPGIRAMNRMSDIIHTLSTKYLYYTLSTKQQYNYIITLNPYSYTTHEFTEIFNCSHVSVLKRTAPYRQRKQSLNNRKSRSNKENQSIFSPLPDVLEYEGSWLLTIGHYRKSSERLRASLSHGSNRIRPYQLLSLCYHRAGNYSAAKQVQYECFGRYGQSKCEQPQPKLILNQNVKIVPL